MLIDDVTLLFQEVAEILDLLADRGYRDHSKVLFALIADSYGLINEPEVLPHRPQSKILHLNAEARNVITQPRAIEFLLMLFRADQRAGQEVAPWALILVLIFHADVAW